MDGNVDESSIIEEKVNPNVNCLEGKQCPKCGSYGPFEIIVLMRVMLYDDGIGDADEGAPEYNEDAPTTCYVCRFQEKFGAFDVR
jgi:hypothetical protein